MEWYFEQRINSWQDVPKKTEQQRVGREKAKNQAMAEKQQWMDKVVAKYAASRSKENSGKDFAIPPCAFLRNKISIREGNQEQAIALGRSTEYDGVAVRIASVYALSHWGMKQQSATTSPSNFAVHKP